MRKFIFLFIAIFGFVIFLIAISKLFNHNDLSFSKTSSKNSISKNNNKDTILSNYNGLLIPALSYENKLEGYVNLEDEFIISPKYDHCDNFNGNFAIVSKSNKKGFINKKGVEITPIIYSSLLPFSEGIAVATKGNNKVGFIDTTGREILPFIYNSAWDFSEGLAQVMYTSNDLGYTYIDRYGNKIIENIQGDAPNPYSNGLLKFTKKGKSGFIDKTGSIIIQPIYDFAFNFSEGFAPVEINNKWGLIDKNGNFLVDPKYYFTWGFKDGLCHLISNCKDKNTYSVCDNYFSDKYGQIKIALDKEPNLYEYVSWFKEGFASVKKNGLYGFINKQGSLVIPCIYESSNDFNNGIAYVKKNGKYIYIDKSGNCVLFCSN